MKIYFIVNHCAFFVSHRLALAVEAKRKGWDVKLIIGQAGSEEMEMPAVEKLNRAGIKYQRLSFTTVGMNPFRELLGLLQLILILRKEKPNIVHTVSPKGMLYGGVAARLARIKGLIVAISGMGYLYSSKGGLVKRSIVKVVDMLTSFVLRHSNKMLIVQNQDDLNYFVDKRSIENKRVCLIPGSGVELNKFPKSNIAESNIVLFPARLLKDKGIYEFVEAARIIRAKGCDWKFVLAGAANYGNPTSVNKELAESWVEEGIVEWLGYVGDMIPIYAKSAIVCLPSYREGMPKVLLEAAAAGKAVVTTDVIGCREAIIDGKTGILVPDKSVTPLVEALELLINDKDKRELYGNEGRKLAEKKFSIESVISSTFGVYEKLDTSLTNK